MKAICGRFRTLIEDNQLSHLLFDKEDKPKHEDAAQRLFFGIASAYCEANGLDLSPESDAGRGPVDFKVSSGLTAKGVVEIKLTSNGKPLQGFLKQLPIYQNAERAQYGIYLVIDTGKASSTRLLAFRNEVTKAGTNAPEVVWVDATSKPSASKAK